MSTYRAGNKNQAFQNQNQHGQNQQNRSNENFGNRRSRSESRNRGRGRESRSQSRPRNQNNTNQTSYRGRKCGRCGKDFHQKPEQCPAMKSKCDRCQKIGHWAGMCRSRINFGDYNDVQTTTEDTGANVSNVVQRDERKLNSVNEFIGSTEAEINSSSLRDLDCIVVQLSKEGTNSQSVRALPDTGANVNVLPGEIAKLLGHRSQMSNGGPKLIDGSQLRTSGRCSKQLKHQNQSMEVDWLVVDNAEKTILGVDLCKKLKLVHQNFPFCEVKPVEMSPEIKLGHGKTLDIVASKYPEVFCGKIRGIHDELVTIQLIHDAKPSSIKKYRDIPEAYKEPLKRELEGLSLIHI